jgi:hypothetical protein
MKRILDETDEKETAQKPLSQTQELASGQYISVIFHVAVYVDHHKKGSKSDVITVDDDSDDSDDSLDSKEEDGDGSPTKTDTSANRQPSESSTTNKEETTPTEKLIDGNKEANVEDIHIYKEKLIEVQVVLASTSYNHTYWKPIIEACLFGKNNQNGLPFPEITKKGPKINIFLYLFERNVDNSNCLLDLYSTPTAHGVTNNDTFLVRTFPRIHAKSFYPWGHPKEVIWMEEDLEEQKKTSE